jgi:hypothetical protein
MTTRGTTLAALLGVLGRPTSWLLALAGFLARGGILAFLLGVVTLPSPLALSNVLAPLLVPIVFGGVTPFLVAVIAIGIGSVVLWIVVGGWLAAATEVVLIRDARHAAAEEGLAVRPDGSPRRWLIVRVTAAHFLAHVPLIVTSAVGSISIVNVTYSELVNPFDVSTPLPVRIIHRAAAPIVVIAIAWIVGEIAGGLAARRIVVGGASIVGGVLRAYADLVIRPWSALLPNLLTLTILLGELGSMVGAVALSWTAARSRLAELPKDWTAIAIGLVGLAAVWCLSLVIAGIISAWRSVTMTLEAERSAVAAGADSVPVAADGRDHAGTIGASTHRRPGDWSAGSPGGSL